MRALVLAAAAAGALAAGAASAAPKPDPALIQQGHDVFQKWCAPCHGPGPGHPGTDALQAKYHGSKPAPLEERRDLTPDQTRFFVRHGVSIMPPFRKTEVTDADLEGIAAYLSRAKR
jgi:mono/diheme cytochrome c family protein